jgi:hypothetical protein
MLTFDPTLFIMQNQDLFMTLGAVVGLGTTALVLTAVITMLALRSMK